MPVKGTLLLKRVPPGTIRKLAVAPPRCEEVVNLNLIPFVDWLISCWDRINISHSKYNTVYLTWFYYSNRPKLSSVDGRHSVSDTFFCACSRVWKSRDAITGLKLSLVSCLQTLANTSGSISLTSYESQVRYRSRSCLRTTAEWKR